ncbi:hypothetical protein CHISP_0981 [Chitinispirillum alkaliphilum]|nr:hypothetical protein CHISP_0981 [Chitinispirillum alkaliphilum]
MKVVKDKNNRSGIQKYVKPVKMNCPSLLFLLIILSGIVLHAGADNLVSNVWWSATSDDFGSTVADTTPLIEGVATMLYTIIAEDPSENIWPWAILTSSFEDPLTDLQSIEIEYRSSHEFAVRLDQPPLDELGQAYEKSVPQSSEWRTETLLVSEFAQPDYLSEGDRVPLDLDLVTSLTFAPKSENTLIEGTLEIRSLVLSNELPDQNPNPPTDPVHGEVCESGDVTLSVTVPEGITVDWYDQSEGGDPILQNNTALGIHVEATTTYYAEARNLETGLVSTSRTEVFATVNPLSQGGEVTADRTVINLGESVTLTVAGQVGAVVDWERKIDQGSFESLSHSGDTYATTPEVTGEWKFRAVVRSGACSISHSTICTVMVIPTTEKTWQLTYNADKGGSIEGIPSQTVPDGGNGETVTAVPNEGYIFAGWSDGVTEPSRTETNVTENITVTANFSSTSVTLTYIAGEGGTISGEALQNVPHGGNGNEVTAVPNEGYTFAGWSDGVTEPSRTETNVTENITVTANFSSTSVTLTYIAGEGGTISGEALQNVPHGGNGNEVTAVPNEGYNFAGWSDGITEPSRTETNVTENITVTANFNPVSFTLTYKAEEGGTITGDTEQNVVSGQNGTPVTAVANEGFTFTGWSDGATENPRTDNNVQQDLTVTAQFQIKQHTLTYDVAGSGGSLEGELEQQIKHGANGTPVEAVADDGFVFREWSDNSVDNPRTDENITEDKVIYAYFDAVGFTLTYTAGPNGTLDIDTVQRVNHGADGHAVEAIPDFGYGFVKWSDQVRDNPRIDTAVTADIAVEAIFANLNSVEIEKAEFIGDSLKFRVLFSLSDDYFDNLEYGYTLCKTNDCSDKPSIYRPLESPVEFSTAPLGSDIKFERDYYINIWVRMEGQTKGVPQKTSYAVRVGEFTMQPISYFSQPPAPVHIDNSRMLLSANQWRFANLPDTIRSFDDGDLEGFYEVSRGYQFTVAENAYPFTLGLKAENIPDGYSIDDVRMYRWIEQLESWIVVHDYSMDRDKKFVYTEIDLSSPPSLSKPFKLMIDTSRFEVDILSDITSPVQMRDSIIDTVKISSVNVANITLRHYNSTANEPLRLRSEKVLSSKEAKVTFTIPSVRVTNRAGVNAVLVISDGMHTDTLNISRSVRSLPDALTIEPLTWQPLFVKADLDNKNLGAVLATLDDNGDESDWEYDNTRYRVFRWYAKPGSNKDQWVEYSDELKNDFKLEPGRVMWIKSAEMGWLSLDSAKSVSLREPYVFAVPPRQWVDFTLPYLFNVRLGDILHKTEGSERLEIYKWDQSGSSSSYRAEPLYIHGVSALSNPTEIIYGERGNEKVYTAYNNSNDTIYLTLPPIISEASSYMSSVARRSASPAWHLTLDAVASGDVRLNPVMIGSNDSEKRLSVPPTMGNVLMSVSDFDAESYYGHIFTPELPEGKTFRLKLHNKSNQRVSVDLTTLQSQDFPEDIEVLFVDPSSSNIAEDLNVTLQGNSSEEFILVVGSQSYAQSEGFTLEGMKFSLAELTAVPSRRSVTLQYFMPSVGVSAIEMSIVDLRGRVVWNSIHTGNRNQWNTLHWNGINRSGSSVPAGTYIVRVKTIDHKGKVAEVFDRRLMMVH